jgi:hypothetical protein
MNLLKSLLIELPLGNSTKVSFGDQSILRGKKILTVLPTPSISPSGGNVLGLAGSQLVDLLAGATLTLKTGSNQDIHADLPLRWLFASAAAGHPLNFGDAGAIEWSKSWITIPPGTAGAGSVIQVSVIYQ